jgi:hypothetical protein
MHGIPDVPRKQSRNYWCSHMQNLLVKFFNVSFAIRQRHICVGWLYMPWWWRVMDWSKSGLFYALAWKKLGKPRTATEGFIPAPRFNEEVPKNYLKNFVSKCQNICSSLRFSVSQSYKTTLSIILTFYFNSLHEINSYGLTESIKKSTGWIYFW